MGVAASILIGVGIYELIEHRHEIKTRCTHATTNDVERNEGSEVHVSSEKTQNLKRSRIPHLRPEKRAKREEEKDGSESTEHGKDIAPPEKAKKKRKRSFIPRLRTSKPNANAGLERVDSSADNKNVDSLTGSQLRDTSEDAPVCGPPPPYTPPLPTGMLVEN